MLAHLAVYAGWPSAVTALEAYDQVYASRRVDTAALRVTGERLAASVSDAARTQGVTDSI